MLRDNHIAHLRSLLLSDAKITTWDAYVEVRVLTSGSRVTEGDVGSYLSRQAANKKKEHGKMTFWGLKGIRPAPKPLRVWLFAQHSVLRENDADNE